MEKRTEKSPGHRQRLGIRRGKWASGEAPKKGSIEAVEVVGDNLAELMAVVSLLKLSRKKVKILAVHARNVKKAALVFKRLGVQGLVRDTSGSVGVIVS